MSNLTKLNRSNRSHKKLAEYHAKKYKETGDGEHWIKNGYHNSVLRKQKESKKMLTQKEKELTYKNSKYYWYN